LTPSFNPSIGMVFIHAFLIQEADLVKHRFQSLNRDGVHSRQFWRWLGSHPRSFQSLNRDGVHSRRVRSISAIKSRMFQSLNRDGVHSRLRFTPTATTERKFQSLNRDGVHSRLRFTPTATTERKFQSLNRDGVHSRGKQFNYSCYPLTVSIPQSGWCSFAPGAGASPYQN